METDTARRTGRRKPHGKRTPSSSTSIVIIMTLNWGLFLYLRVRRRTALWQNPILRIYGGLVVGGLTHGEFDLYWSWKPLETDDVKKI